MDRNLKTNLPQFDFRLKTNRQADILTIQTFLKRYSNQRFHVHCMIYLGKAFERVNFSILISTSNGAQVPLTLKLQGLYAEVL